MQLEATIQFKISKLDKTFIQGIMNSWLDIDNQIPNETINDKW